MLEKYLQKGMAANWLPTTQLSAAYGNGKELSIQTESVKGGEGIYLPFVANGINYVESQGKDVISFNFTGCLMAAYTAKNGSRRVAHISTGADQDCKEEWDRIKSESSGVKVFKPDDHGDIAAVASTQQGWNCYGLITSTGECFSIVVGGFLNDSGNKQKMVIVLGCTKVDV